jgi:hypothetical protein
VQSDLAAKLRLTLKVLGCSSAKELCARFRAVNPATHCEVERLNKWLQGRAQPRAARFYDDWAKVVGSNRAGGWFASCTVEALGAELARLFDADARALLAGETAAASTAGAVLPGGWVLGHYACYSQSFSPYTRGRLVRGALVLQRGRRTGLTAVYTETYATGTATFRCEAVAGGRVLNLPLLEPESGVIFMMTLFMPGPPASVMAGVISGATIMSQDPRPSSARVLVVRAPDAGALLRSNRYIDPQPGTLASDLRALGLELPAAASFDALAHDFLMGGNGGLDQITAEDQYRLSALVDPAYLQRHPTTVA